MLTVRLEAELEGQLEALAETRRCSKSELVREAIVRLLEDAEDLALLGQASVATTTAKPLAQLRRELGLDG